MSASHPLRSHLRSPILGDVRQETEIIATTLPSAVSPYYAALNPNPVAAFPFLGFLAVREVFSRRATLVVPAWCIAVWFSVVYLGEHYVVDVIAGVALAAATWWVLNNVVAPRYWPFRATTAGITEPLNSPRQAGLPIAVPATSVPDRTPSHELDWGPLNPTRGVTPAPPSVVATKAGEDRAS